MTLLSGLFFRKVRIFFRKFILWNPDNFVRIFVYGRFSWCDLAKNIRFLEKNTMFFGKVPVQTNSCNQNLCNDSWIPSHFWVLYAGNPSTIWLTVLSVSNRARLSLQLFWNHQIFRHIFEIGAFIHFDLERGNYPPPIGWFDFLSFFLYSKLHQKLKSIFIKRRNKKKSQKEDFRVWIP